MKFLASSFDELVISFVAICGFTRATNAKTVTLVAIGQTNPPKQTVVTGPSKTAIMAVNRLFVVGFTNWFVNGYILQIKRIKIY